MTFDRFLFGSLLFVIAWAPLPFGSNRPWAAMLLAAIVFLLGLVWLSAFLFEKLSLEKTSVDTTVFHKAKWPILLLAAVQGWIFLQLVPLPAGLVGLLSPQTLALNSVPSLIPLTLDSQATLFYLLKSLSYFVVFLLVLALVTTRRRVEFLLWTMLLSGLVQTVYGSLMVLSGVEWGFFVEKYVGKGVATGTFVNRNHLAGYLVLCLSAGIGLLLSKLESSSHANWRELVRRWLALLLSRKVLLRVFLALMVIGLVLTRSRMGNIAFFVSLAIAGAVALYSGRKFSARLVALIGSLFVIDAWIVGQWFGFDEVVERLEQTNPLEEHRVDISVQTGSILEDFPLFGSGGGSYYGIFGHYQSAGTGGYLTHAHNDYLEIAGDIGLPGLALLGGFVVLSLIQAVKIQSQSSGRLQKGVGFSSTMAVCWLILHSAVDFNLQIPANAMTLMILLALVWPVSRLKGRQRGSSC